MSISTSSKKTTPALDYDQVHVSSFTFIQGENGVKQVESTAKYYAVDVDGEKFFDADPDDLIKSVSQDFDMDAVIYAIQNKVATDATDAITQYVAAKAKVNQDYADGKISQWELMANFELAIGFFHLIKGNLKTISIK